MCSLWFQFKNVKQSPKLKLTYLYACWIMYMRQHLQIWNETPKVTRNAFNIGEGWNPVCCHGNKTVELKLWSTLSRIVLQRIKHFWYKIIGWDIFFPSYLIKWRHHLANMHILKPWISLEQKEIFENSKQYFSSHAGYLFMRYNGFDRKDAIFVIVAL